MRKEADLENMKTEEMVSLIEKHTKAKLPKNITAKRRYVIDLFKNRCHGSEFIRDDEILKNGKITRKPFQRRKTIIKDCPNCKSKTLESQPFPKGTEMEGSFWCTTCGYVEAPNMEAKQ